MEGVIWLFLALIVALVALGVVLVGLRRRPSRIDQEPRHCSSCQTPMSLRRVPLFQSLTRRGKWVCPHCRTTMNKQGRVAETAT
jgi:hypothetical protein